MVVNCELKQVHDCIVKFEASPQRKKGGEVEAVVNPFVGKEDGTVVLDPAYGRGGKESLLVAGSAVRTQVTLLIATDYFLGRDAFSRKMAGQEAVFALSKPQEVISVRPVASGDETGRASSRKSSLRSPSAALGQYSLGSSSWPTRTASRSSSTATR